MYVYAGTARHDSTRLDSVRPLPVDRLCRIPHANRMLASRAEYIDCHGWSMFWRTASLANNLGLLLGSRPLQRYRHPLLETSLPTDFFSITLSPALVAFVNQTMGFAFSHRHPQQRRPSFLMGGLPSGPSHLARLLGNRSFPPPPPPPPPPKVDFSAPHHGLFQRRDSLSCPQPEGL
jgi:hypothetical protein